MRVKCKKAIDVGGITFFKKGQVVEVHHTVSEGRVWAVIHPYRDKSSLRGTPEVTYIFGHEAIEMEETS